MRILHIEDEGRSIRQTEASIKLVFPEADIQVAQTLEKARRVMANSSFDLAICDIRIGLNQGSLDASETHGLAAYEELRVRAPGTPVMFLSAFATLQNTTNLTARGGTANAFGISNFPMTQVVEKGDPAKVEAYLRSIKDGLDRLTLCLVTGAESLGPMFTRAVQIYGLSIPSTSATVTPMSGLSGARVGLVRFSQAQSSDVVVVVKLDSHARIAPEIERYRRLVAPRLTVGSFAPQFETIKAGLRGMTAVFSSVASPTSRSLFSRLENFESVDIAKVKSAISAWATTSNSTTTTVGDLRRMAIPDDALEQLSNYGPDLMSADHLSLDLTWKLAHGDFHGENILIDDSGSAIIIDFADCDMRPSGSDPAALELSLLCHPKSPLDKVWSTAPCDSWSDIDTFVNDSPWSSEVRDIRAWAIAESGEMQALAVYLGQACWLMKHGGPGAVRAKSVALSAVSRLLELADARPVN